MKSKDTSIWLNCIIFLVVFALTGCNKESDEKKILSFVFADLNPSVTATISGQSITATVPENTDISNLAPTIEISEKASVNPTSGTPRDFTNTVNYTVTAEDGSIQGYHVNVTIEGEPDFININWSTIAEPPSARGFMPAVVLNDKIYVIGGIIDEGALINTKSMEVYDPATDTWDTGKSDLNIGRNGHSATAVNNKIYVMGGIEGLIGPALNSCEVYDPTTDTWTELTPMPNVRAAHAACVLEGKIYLIGGEVTEPPGGTYLSTIDVYNPSDNTWSAAQDLPKGITWWSASVANGKIYAIGGASESGGIGLETVYEYDPTLDSWTKKNNIKTGRWCLTTVAMDNMIFCLGGAPAPTSTGSTRVEVYNPEKDKCYSATGFLSKSFGQGACVYQNKIYVFGGCNSAPPTYESYKKGAEVGIPEWN